ncbi:hypothetical protein STIAU_6334 [Stigmatella aurantiaca DW4/3-1]|uniref:Uncharacterized protein n=1 Tax=Stigmatella aurantiaca (strain DW4/3-1) TaxID=378806 RepID=Q08W32_STIAD|nr:hypothetical protein STIAU_6334 [Stigmatella aurantiaca DW4/3-1]
METHGNRIQAGSAPALNPSTGRGPRRKRSPSCLFDPWAGDLGEVLLQNLESRRPVPRRPDDALPQGDDVEPGPDGGQGLTRDEHLPGRGGGGQPPGHRHPLPHRGEVQAGMLPHHAHQRPGGMQTDAQRAPLLRGTAGHGPLPVHAQRQAGPHRPDRIVRLGVGRPEEGPQGLAQERLHRTIETEDEPAHLGVEFRENGACAQGAQFGGEGGESHHLHIQNGEGALFQPRQTAPAPEGLDGAALGDLEGVEAIQGAAKKGTSSSGPPFLGAEALHAAGHQVGHGGARVEHDLERGLPACGRVDVENAREGRLASNGDAEHPVHPIEDDALAAGETPVIAHVPHGQGVALAHGLLDDGIRDGHLARGQLAAVAHRRGDERATGVAQQHHGGGGLGALEHPVHDVVEKGGERVGGGQGLGGAKEQHERLVGDARRGGADGAGLGVLLEGKGGEVVERAQHVQVLHVLGEDDGRRHVLPMAEAPDPACPQIDHLRGGVLHGVRLPDGEGVLAQGDGVARAQGLAALQGGAVDAAAVAAAHVLDAQRVPLDMQAGMPPGDELPAQHDVVLIRAAKTGDALRQVVGGIEIAGAVDDDLPHRSPKPTRPARQPRTPGPAPGDDFETSSRRRTPLAPAPLRRGSAPGGQAASPPSANPGKVSLRRRLDGRAIAGDENAGRCFRLGETAALGPVEGRGDRHGTEAGAPVSRARGSPDPAGPGQREGDGAARLGVQTGGLRRAPRGERLAAPGGGHAGAPGAVLQPLQAVAAHAGQGRVGGIPHGVRADGGVARGRGESSGPGPGGEAAAAWPEMEWAGAGGGGKAPGRWRGANAALRVLPAGAGRRALRRGAVALGRGLARAGGPAASRVRRGSAAQTPGRLSLTARAPWTRQPARALLRWAPGPGAPGSGSPESPRCRRPWTSPGAPRGQTNGRAPAHPWVRG